MIYNSATAAPSPSQRGSVLMVCNASAWVGNCMASASGPHVTNGRARVSQTRLLPEFLTITNTGKAHRSMRLARETHVLIRRNGVAATDRRAVDVAGMFGADRNPVQKADGPQRRRYASFPYGSHVDGFSYQSKALSR